MISQSKQDRVTIKLLEQMKSDGEKISMLTAYDYSFAKIIDNAGVDIILVGDSASNVMAGHETTLPITLDQMIYHASSVVRAVKRALVVVDLPFGTYQADSKVALKSAIRIMKESGAHAVKLEGGKLVKDSIERILKAGIPVMGHLGLTPQSIYKFGTYSVRAKEEKEAKTLIDDALLLEKSGCFSLVLEKIPNILSKKVSNKFICLDKNNEKAIEFFKNYKKCHNDSKLILFNVDIPIFDGLEIINTDSINKIYKNLFECEYFINFDYYDEAFYNVLVAIKAKTFCIINKNFQNNKNISDNPWIIIDDKLPSYDNLFSEASRVNLLGNMEKYIKDFDIKNSTQKWIDQFN